MKLTDWIPTSTPPTIVGWYERKYCSPIGQKYCDWWDGKQFIVFDTSGNNRGPDEYPFFWRGLAKNPNPAKESNDAT